jgi:hypothetical protein
VVEVVSGWRAWLRYLAKVCEGRGGAGWWEELARAASSSRLSGGLILAVAARKLRLSSRVVKVGGASG